MAIIQGRIEQKLQATFNPASLQVLNESYMHAVPPGSESHFKVVVVSDAFTGKRTVARHQAIYAALSEIQPLIHALAIHAYTPEEWQASEASAPQSPACMGGSKADPLRSKN